MIVTVSCRIRSLHHCCGVREIGEITKGKAHYYDYIGEGATYVDAFVKLLECITIPDRDDDDEDLDGGNHGYMLQVWFKKDCLFDGKTWAKNYENHELREIVKNLPNVVHLGCCVNPNSGNIIDGYCWSNNGDMRDE